LGTTDTTVISTNAAFSSLTFASNDSLPNISTAAFTVQYDPLVGDSVIVNLDSIAYKTRIDSFKIIPTFAFKTSSRATLFFTNGDSTVISGSDSVNFSLIDKVKNYATDGVTHKTYKIKVNVHKVQPELYIWNKVFSDLDSHNATNQKALVFNNNIYYYLNDGSSTYLYTSSDGYIWTASNENVNGLPAKASLNDMILFNGKLYLSPDGSNIYSSSNGVDWTKFSLDYNFKSFLFIFNSKLWAVAQSKTDFSYRFASSSDGVQWEIKGEIPSNFPVSDFTSLSFYSRVGNPKVLVVGGYSSDSTILHTSWSSEDLAYWIDFSSENHTLDTLAIGASIISYDDSILLFGERTDGITPHFKISKDEGLSWHIPDSTYNFLPKDFKARSYQSVVVLNPKKYDAVNSPALHDEILKSNRIFIIGGKINSVPCSDVWTGKLNRKNFLRQ
jgi:hypothetical protein